MSIDAPGGLRSHLRGREFKYSLKLGFKAYTDDVFYFFLYPRCLGTKVALGGQVPGRTKNHERKPFDRSELPWHYIPLALISPCRFGIAPTTNDFVLFSKNQKCSVLERGQQFHFPGE